MNQHYPFHVAPVTSGDEIPDTWLDGYSVIEGLATEDDKRLAREPHGYDPYNHTGRYL